MGVVRLVSTRYVNSRDTILNSGVYWQLISSTYLVGSILPMELKIRIVA